MDTKNLFREILDKVDEGREALEKAYKRRDMYHNLFLEGYDSGRLQAILECIEAVEVVIGDRIHDLATCNKNDDKCNCVFCKSLHTILKAQLASHKQQVYIINLTVTV